MRNDYLFSALKVIDDPTILINVVSHRVKQLRRGHRALIESLEKLSAEDIALREIAEGKITYQLATAKELESQYAEPSRNFTLHAKTRITPAATAPAAKAPGAA